jgi:heme-degrading monooxygenase HmoA
MGPQQQFRPAPVPCSCRGGTTRSGEGQREVILSDHRRIVVISVWAKKAEWESWVNSDERRKLEANLGKNLKQSPIIRSLD